MTRFNLNKNLNIATLSQLTDKSLSRGISLLLFSQQWSVNSDLPNILWFFYACDYALHVVYREAFGSKTTQDVVRELLVQNKHLICSVLIVSISYLSSTPVKKEEVLELLLRIKLWRSILGQNISSQILGKSFISY